MHIRGVPLNDFRDLTEEVSSYLYDGNVIVAPNAHPAGCRAIVARLRVLNSRGPGARTSASGRHGPYSCWHAYRDVLREVFEEYPAACVRTVLATYRGVENFDKRFRATRYLDIGSAARPAFVADLCVTSDCGQPHSAMAYLRSPDLDGASASMGEEPAVAEWDDLEEEFCGPDSLLGVPDLAYSSYR
ncbi:hypothetical protein ACIBKX_07865 [Streptomyces sp. NPDC050658]|uniref:hypothetical protein n=1 Tax=unclassified Streptomyces TaxID=2593676 RepID=UPI00341B7AB1